MGPLVSDDWGFLAGPDSPIEIDSLEAARPCVIGGYRGDATANFLKKNGFNVLTAQEDRHNVKLLTAGRIDLWATGSLLGPWLARQEGVTDLRVLHPGSPRRPGTGRNRRGNPPPLQSGVRCAEVRIGNGDRIGKVIV